MLKICMEKIYNLVSYINKYTHMQIYYICIEYQTKINLIVFLLKWGKFKPCLVIHHVQLMLDLNILYEFTRQVGGRFTHIF